MRPRLIAITDTRVAAIGVLEPRLEALCAAAAPGSVMIQLRDRELPVRDRVALGERLAGVSRRTGQLFSVNDRADLALLLGADALHLGEHSIDARDARRVVGDALWISRAIHEPGQAAPGADAVLLSPIVAPRKGRPALGLGALGRRDGTLLYALGGIDADSARACLDAGADGVAVVGAALDGRAPEPLLAALGMLRSAGS